LNLRPPGYEPGELPDCSTPRRSEKYSAGYASVVSDLLWAAVAFCLLVFAFGGIMLIVAAVLGIRLFKNVRGTLVESVNNLAKQADEAEKQLEQLTARADEAQHAFDELAESMRRVQVLLGATRDARQAVSRATRLLPRK
jgi:methyl-accepting chemotaxis protein